MVATSEFVDFAPTIAKVRLSPETQENIDKAIGKNRANPKVLHVYTNEAVQEKFSQAIAILDKKIAISKNDEIANLHIASLLNTLKLYKAYSASSNNIPGLAGLGLREMLDIADLIIGGRTNFRMAFSMNVPHIYS